MSNPKKCYIVQPVILNFDPQDEITVSKEHTLSKAEQEQIKNITNNRTAMILWLAYKSCHLESQSIKRDCLRLAAKIDKAITDSKVKNTQALAVLIDREWPGDYLYGGMLDLNNEEFLHQLFRFLVQKEPFLYAVIRKI